MRRRQLTGADQLQNWKWISHTRSWFFLFLFFFFFGECVVQVCWPIKHSPPLLLGLTLILLGEKISSLTLMLLFFFLLFFSQPHPPPDLSPQRSWHRKKTKSLHWLFCPYFFCTRRCWLPVLCVVIQRKIGLNLQRCLRFVQKVLNLMSKKCKSVFVGILFPSYTSHGSWCVRVLIMHENLVYQRSW